MDIWKLLKRKTASSDDSISSKTTEQISQGKDEENINVSRNRNNEGVETDGLSNDIFYLLDRKPSDNEKFAYIVFQTILLVIWQNNIKIHGESQDLCDNHVDKIGLNNALFCVTLKVVMVCFA